MAKGTNRAESFQKASASCQNDGADLSLLDKYQLCMEEIWRRKKFLSASTTIMTRR